MNKLYRITLKPVDKFFFGGDMTFQVAKDKSDEKNVFNQRYSSYIIQSNFFPQQTSVLGMLRFLILSNAGNTVFKDNKIVDQKEANKLIGRSGFSVNGNNDYGVIKRITHVRVLRIPRNDQEKVEELEYAPLSSSIIIGSNNSWVSCTYNLGELNVPCLSKDQYDAKHGLEVLLLPTDQLDTYYKIMNNWEIVRKKIRNKEMTEESLPKPPYCLSDIFIPDRRVGIAKNAKTGKTADGALFKQISYRFNNKDAIHCFVFEAEVDYDNFENLSGKMVSIGGDNSQFIIDIIDIEEAISKNNNSQSDNSDNLKVTLLSPTYLSRSEVKDNTIFAVTRLMPFRFLRERVQPSHSQPPQPKPWWKVFTHSSAKKEEKNDNGKVDTIKEDGLTYHILNSRLERGERYELYAPGSVFFLGNDQTQKSNLIKAIEGKTNFRQIGYNEYKIIK